MIITLSNVISHRSILKKSQKFFHSIPSNLITLTIHRINHTTTTLLLIIYKTNSSQQLAINRPNAAGRSKTPNEMPSQSATRE
jgi:hypothetical protein